MDASSSPTALALLRSTVVWTAVWSGLHGGLYPVARRVAQISSAKDRTDWQNRFVSVAHALVASFLSVRGLAASPFREMALSTARLQAAPYDYVHGFSSELETLLPLTLGYFVYDSAVFVLEPALYMPAMLIHHIGAGILWPVALRTHLCHFYVLGFGATELSTPFLHLAVYFLPKHDLAGSPVHIAAGLFLVLAFFLIRVAPIPFLAVSWWASKDVFLSLPTPLMWVCAVSLWVPAALNLHFFRLLVRGALKQLSKGGDGEEKAAAAAAISKEKDR